MFNGNDVMKINTFTVQEIYFTVFDYILINTSFADEDKI